ncbi:hypothetical protein B296_00052226 [Ensete ventricosum]|uniref:Uncharacterized protein n=1 Tax=Ensete ventricosum TaxID=4639 RepID=A0A426XSN7_ENSVE|nr:hypothetical protein B296_00052226 [Ensete ventricosum]
MVTELLEQGWALAVVDGDEAGEHDVGVQAGTRVTAGAEGIHFLVPERLLGYDGEGEQEEGNDGEEGKTGEQWSRHGIQDEEVVKAKGLAGILPHRLGWRKGRECILCFHHWVQWDPPERPGQRYGQAEGTVGCSERWGWRTLTKTLTKIFLKVPETHEIDSDEDLLEGPGDS